MIKDIKYFPKEGPVGRSAKDTFEKDNIDVYKDLGELVWLSLL